MPAAVVNKVSRILKIPKAKVEKWWQDAKDSVGEEDWKKVMGIFKKILGDDKLKKLGWKLTSSDLTYVMLSRTRILTSLSKEH